MALKHVHNNEWLSDKRKWAGLKTIGIVKRLRKRICEGRLGTLLLCLQRSQSKNKNQFNL